jgi:hypothetical protein
MRPIGSGCEMLSSRDVIQGKLHKVAIVVIDKVSPLEVWLAVAYLVHERLST